MTRSAVNAKKPQLQHMIWQNCQLQMEVLYVILPKMLINYESIHWVRTCANFATEFYTIVINIFRLGKNKVVTALELYNELKAEAEALRKQKQRNVYSGIHKYLKLLDRQQQFACLEDGLGNVISLPPLTNAESTKVCI